MAKGSLKRNLADFVDETRSGLNRKLFRTADQQYSSSYQQVHSDSLDGLLVDQDVPTVIYGPV